MRLRALIAFLTLPGMVAGLLPVLLVRAEHDHPGFWKSGCVVGGAGLLLLLWCVRDFFVIGRGTLAPWDPPKKLVVVGLYRFVRNPMYLAVLLLLAGWTISFNSRLLLAYGLIVAAACHLRVVFGEEPRLRRQFGAEWMQYSASVRRWLPRFRTNGGRDK